MYLCTIHLKCCRWKLRWYQNMSNLIDAEYYSSKSLRFFYMNLKSFNIQRITEAAKKKKIMISLVSRKVQAEKEWPGVSYEFRTLSCILKLMFPVAWKPKHFWAGDFTDVQIDVPEGKGTEIWVTGCQRKRKAYDFLATMKYPDYLHP